ncbi:MAG: flagellar biosynthetic protein FliQ [Phycisphaerales bacterium]|jgi:flagellar biosynthetic protein FliQ|nr:flagellar biosynthetic protein FliQ [Phycisphaerales bacterium]
MTDALIEMLKSAFLIVLVVASPVLLIGLVVSLLISLMQAMTQVQEQTISLIPRMLAMLIAILLLMHWMFAQVMDFASEMFGVSP